MVGCIQHDATYTMFVNWHSDAADGQFSEADRGSKTVRIRRGMRRGFVLSRAEARSSPPCCLTQMLAPVEAAL